MYLLLASYQKPFLREEARGHTCRSTFLVSRNDAQILSPGQKQYYWISFKVVVNSYIICIICASTPSIHIVIFNKVSILHFVFRMATSADCQLEERFVRLHSLVLSSTRVLKAKFDASFPPDQLKKWSPKDNDLKNAKLSAYQIKHLKANRDSSKFDISLLVSLLRNFCYKNDKTHPLWDELDNDNIVPSLQCEIAQIVRIRNLRNKVCDFALLFITLIG